MMQSLNPTWTGRNRLTIRVRLKVKAPLLVAGAGAPGSSDRQAKRLWQRYHPQGDEGLGTHRFHLVVPPPGYGGWAASPRRRASLAQAPLAASSFCASFGLEVGETPLLGVAQ